MISTNPATVATVEEALICMLSLVSTCSLSRLAHYVFSECYCVRVCDVIVRVCDVSVRLNKNIELYPFSFNRTLVFSNCVADESRGVRAHLLASDRMPFYNAFM
jgi:hypothetical protein